MSHRTAKNKRLLIELTLIQLSQLTAQPTPEQPQTAIPPVNALIAAEEKKAPTIKGTTIGFSIRNTPKDPAESHPKPEEPTSQPATAPEEDRPLDENELNLYWQEYAKQMPSEQKALAIRMQNIRVVLLDETTFEMPIENNIIANEFTALIPELQTYLQAHLKNKNVTMTVRVTEPAENKRPVNRTEKFQLMAQKNDALIMLKEEFGLEFS
jgi:DNA polymerase-3 subunit gamma/tau